VFLNYLFFRNIESNRDILKEGNSLLITLIKNITEENNRFKKINVKKISSLKEFTNRPINEITFSINSVEKLNDLMFLTKENGNTQVQLKLHTDNKNLTFKLKNKRKVDREILRSLKNKDISSLIS